MPLFSCLLSCSHVHTCKESEDECKALCKQIVEEWLRREAEKKRREEEEEEEKARQLNGRFV